MYLGNGVRGHGAADARGARGTLGNRRDAVRRVLTGRGQGRVITGHAQTVLYRKQTEQNITGGYIRQHHITPQISRIIRFARIHFKTKGMV